MHTPAVLPVLFFLASVACAQAAEVRSPAAPSEPTPGAPLPEPAPAREFDHTHALWDQVLRAHVHGDGFDYGAVKEDPTQLDAYLAELHAVTPAELETWTKKQRYAFWINVYNAHTIQKVVDNYPLKSIRKLDRAFGLKSIFDREFIPMNAFDPSGKGDELSLNDVEHEILRARFQDARVHAAINCASYSCPPLLDEAFVADRLDEQLAKQMTAFVRDRKRNRLNPDDDELELSEIFKWFAEDFERDAGSVREYVVRFSPPEQAEAIRKAKIRYLDYDWDLNDVSP